MTGPQNPAAASGGQLRASHADRERIVEALKGAFVQGRLTADELGDRVGRALTARTGAELAVLTADLPVSRSMRAGPMPPVRRPLANAAARSGGYLAIAFAAVWVGVHLDNGLGPSPYKSWIPVTLFVAMAAVLAAFGIFLNGVATAIEHRRSRRPPRISGPSGRRPAGR